MDARRNCRLCLAQALCALAALLSLGGSPRAAAAQALVPLASPVKLPGANNFLTATLGVPGMAAIAESPADGSFEWVAAAQVQSQFSSTAYNIEATHFSSGGQAGPATFASQATGPTHNQLFPAVAALQQGGFVTAWANEAPFCDTGDGCEDSIPVGAIDTVSLRLLDGTGQPVGAEIQLNPDSGVPAGDVLLAAASSGGFVASFFDGFFGATMFSSAGEVLTGPVMIGGDTVGRNLGLVGLADGGFIAAWGGSAGISWQRFNAAGTPLAPAVQVLSVDNNGPALLAANPAGQVAVAWMTNPFTMFSSVLVQLYSAGGAALAPPVTVAASGVGSSATFGNPVLGGLAVNLQGQALAAWSDFYGAGFVQLIDATGALAGAPVQIPPQEAGAQVPQEVVAESNGSWSVLWASSADSYVQKFSSAACSPSAASLCLDDNRFRLDLQFTDPGTGGAGAGNPVPLSAGTGALWFFDPSVPEVVAKVIDGTAVNGHFWVFFASLTNVEFDLTVTDTQTGGQRVYHNPAGTLASQADTAFPPGPAAGPSARPAAAVATVLPGARPTAARSTATRSTAAVGSTPRAPGAEPVCNSSNQALCLLGSEFAVTVTFKETAGSPAAAGQAVQLSADGGYYWFFGPDDTEVAVKVLDGRAVNGHIWVFYASLTNVEFDLTVTDSFSPTQASRTYHNPAGTLASAADIGAF